jgi:hypothetical protein
MRTSIMIAAALASAVAAAQARRPPQRQMPARSAVSTRYTGSTKQTKPKDDEVIIEAGPESVCYDQEKTVFVHYAPIDGESGIPMDIRAKENWGRFLWVGTYTCDFESMIPEDGRHYGLYAIARSPYGEVPEDADPRSKKARDMHKCSAPSRAADGEYELVKIADEGEKFTIICDIETNRVTLKGANGNRAVVQY